MATKKNDNGTVETVDPITAWMSLTDEQRQVLASQKLEEARARRDAADEEFKRLERTLLPFAEPERTIQAEVPAAGGGYTEVAFKAVKALNSRGVPAGLSAIVEETGLAKPKAAAAIKRLMNDGQLRKRGDRRSTTYHAK